MIYQIRHHTFRLSVIPIDTFVVSDPPPIISDVSEFSKAARVSADWFLFLIG